MDLIHTQILLRLINHSPYMYPIHFDVILQKVYVKKQVFYSSWSSKH